MPDMARAISMWNKVDVKMYFDSFFSLNICHPYLFCKGDLLNHQETATGGFLQSIGHFEGKRIVISVTKGLSETNGTRPYIEILIH